MTTEAEARFATPRVSVGVVFRTDDGRVLLVKPTYKDGWEIPGGYVEQGEDLLSAAAREVKEELCVNWPIGEMLVVDWAPHPLEGDRIAILFDGGLLRADQIAAASADGNEISEVRLFREEHLQSVLPPRLEPRVRAAMKHSPLTYLENGMERR